MRPDTPAIRDRILAALRHAAPNPLTTKAVCDAVGPFHKVLPGAANCVTMHRHLGAQLVECQHPTGHLIAVPLYDTNRGYVNLRALEAEGLVVRHTAPGRRDVSWSAVDAAGVDVEMLEELWSR